MLDTVTILVKILEEKRQQFIMAGQQSGKLLLKLELEKVELGDLNFLQIYLYWCIGCPLSNKKLQHRNPKLGLRKLRNSVIITWFVHQRARKADFYTVKCPAQYVFVSRFFKKNLLQSLV